MYSYSQWNNKLHENHYDDGFTCFPKLSPGYDQYNIQITNKLCVFNCKIYLYHQPPHLYINGILNLKQKYMQGR